MSADTDKAVVKPESRPTLEQIAKLLTSQPQLNVFIVGHTDSRGSDEVKQAYLGQAA